MNLSEHFEDTELGVAGCEQRLIDNAQFLCTQILEPLRSKFGAIIINDGYRDPGHNARVGGKPASYHLFEDGKAAADVRAVVATPSQIFDWLRFESDLLFDKVILERNATGYASVVHVQIDRLNLPRRQAFTGDTGAGQVYQAQFVNPLPKSDFSTPESQST